MNIIEGKISIPDVRVDTKDLSHTSCYHNETIYLKHPSYITDDELVDYYSDILTHEYLHHLLEVYFDSRILSCLLDVIQDNFRLNELQRKCLKYNNVNGELTWDIWIKKYGMDRFFERYFITKQAYERLTKKLSTTKFK